MSEETLTFTLDCGDDKGGEVKIKLRSDLAPNHVARITELAKEGFYDGVVFHRVIPNFMAQGGDPTGTGMSGSEQAQPRAGVLRRSAQARHVLDGAHQRSELGQLAVLHLQRRCPLP